MKNLILFLFLLPSILFAQNDCTDAISVCGNSGYSDLKVSGFGVQELSGSNSCDSQENNSIWFKLNIKTSGTLGFTLTPTNTDITEDFDFFVFGSTATCGSLGTAIRCSTTNPQAAGQSDNLTGMNASETETSSGPGADGNGFVKWLDVTAGESYFLVVDRPIGNSNFNLTWTGTATFYDQPIIDSSILSSSTLDLNQCDADDIDDDITNFDLTTNDAIIGSQTDIDITYHISNNDAIIGMNAIKNPDNYRNTSNPQSIFIRLTNKVTECFTTERFSLNVNPYVNLGEPNNLTACSSNGFNTFDLTINNFISTNSLDKISFHSFQSDAENNTNSLPTSYTNKTSFVDEVIWIRVENSEGCFSLKNFNLAINPLPVIIDTITLEQCDTDSDLSTIINLTIAQKNISVNHLNETFKYYPTQSDAINDTSEITNQTAHTVANGTTIWVRTISDKNCYRISKIDIVVGYAADISYSKQFNACDDFLDIDGNNNSSNDDTDGISNFDLSSVPTDVKALFPAGSRPNLKVLIFENIADRDVLKNPIVNLSEYRNKNIPAKTPQKLYIKIINKINNNCTGIGSFDILVNTLPNFKLDSTAFVCLNNPKTKLEPTSPDDTYTYSWNLKGNPTILSATDSFDVLKGGTYVLTATNKNGCTRSKEIVVNESINPTLNDNDIIVLDDTNNNGLDSYSIKIITKNNNLGVGNYQFALIKDGSFIFTFQDQPIFKNITGGIYTVVVNDKNGCTPDATLDVAVIQYDKFFTPNGDGKNDTWKIKGLNSDLYPSANITIADRFGKIMAIIPIDRKGWDGTYKGKTLSSNDYWFKIQLVDKNGKNYQHQGHFSLLRR